jgi:PKD repeat protein
VVTLHVIDASGENSNGSAWVDVTGGSGSYTYQWSSGSTNRYVNNLEPGNYTVQVSDGHCPVVHSFSVGTHPVIPGNILAAEYYFDTDPGTGLGIPMNISAADTAEYFTGCNVTGLSLGYHNMFIRVMDSYHRWSFHKQVAFYIHDIPGQLTVANQPPITSGEYFVDLDVNNNPDPGVGNGTAFTVAPGDLVEGDFAYTVDTLYVGFHHIAARVEDQDGKWSHNYPDLFYIYDTTYSNLESNQPILTAAEYFLDNDPGIGNGIPVPVTSGDLVVRDFGIPLGATPLGQHYLYIRVKDSGKKWSNYARASFGVFQCTQPDVDFTFTPGCITTPVLFTDLSVNVDPAATYAWDFNNDGTVDDVTHGSVAHQYTVPGIYQCKLKITHNVACFDSVIKTVVFPFVYLQNDTTIYTDQSIVLDGGPGYSYLWNSGATTQTITVNGSTAGIGLHNYSVVVTNGLACNATDNINITVTLPPRDLVILSASMLPETIPAMGDSADLQCEVKNTGTISAVASVVQFYLSADNVKSADDLFLGFGIVNALAPGASEAVTSRQFVPAGVEGQMRYIIFVADGAGIVVENNEENNTFALSFLYGAGAIPAAISVLDQIVASGQVRCFNATGTITVAGAGSLFQVLPGGSATFIAGINIRYLAGTKVFSGGYMHGYITGSGQYCSLAANPIVASDTAVVKSGFTGPESDREPPGSRFCYIYPNPTHGGFRLILSPNNREWPVNVRIYNTYGVLVKETVLKEGRSHMFSLQDQSPGIYFLHIGHGSSTEVEKMIRY